MIENSSSIQVFIHAAKRKLAEARNRRSTPSVSNPPGKETENPPRCGIFIALVGDVAHVSGGATDRQPRRPDAAHASPHYLIMPDSVLQDGHSLPCTLSVVIPSKCTRLFLTLRNQFKVRYFSNGMHTFATLKTYSFVPIATFW